MQVAPFPVLRHRARARLFRRMAPFPEPTPPRLANSPTTFQEHPPMRFHPPCFHPSEAHRPLRLPPLLEQDLRWLRGVPSPALRLTIQTFNLFLGRTRQ